MSGAVITGSFAMAGLGAYYLLANRHIDYARLFVTLGVIVGLIASIIQLYPSGDAEGQQVTNYQPVKLAAMEGLFHTEKGAGIIIIGQPDTTRQQLDNPIIVPGVLSFLTYQRWSAEVKGLDAFPANQWPDTVELLYYSYHIMVGLGTFHLHYGARFSLVAVGAPPLPLALDALDTDARNALSLYRQHSRLVHDRTRSPTLDRLRLAGDRPGNFSDPLVWKHTFTLIGFAGLYLLLGLLYVVLVVFEAQRGPVVEEKIPQKVEEFAD